MRTLPLVALTAVCAVALMPSTASAAPKKGQLRFSATAYSVAENAGTTTVRVLRSGNANATATVQLAIDPTTTAGAGDYSITSPAALSAGHPVTLTFAPGVTQQNVTVSVVDNTTSDPNKKVVFKLSGASANAHIQTPTTTLTILDNDGPGTLDFSSPTYTVVESGGMATITVNRVGASNLALSVDYATTTVGSTASAVTDYTATSGTLTFASGQMSKTFQVPITNDSLAESSETVNVSLSNPKNLTNPLSPPQVGPNSPSTLTINDDDVSTYSFQQTLSSVNENDASGQATITVVRGGATNIASSVTYATSDGTATAGSDYTAATGTLNFAAGQTTATFNVPIINDTASEANESVNLTLSQSGTTVATSQLSIVDNDNPKGSVQLSDVAYTVTEGSGPATVTVTLSHPVDADVTVNYATSDGTAVAGTDYTATSGTLTFFGNIHNGGPGTGDTQKTFPVPIINDSIPEDPDAFNVTLSGASPAASALLGSPATAAVTINDDDPAGDLEFENLGYDVNENAGTATVAVHRVGGSNGTVTVDYTTSDGSAVAPDDYAATSGTLTFGPGETEKAFTVPVVWDGKAEGPETVNLALSNPTGGSDLSTNNAAVLRIADDGASGPFQLSSATYSAGESDGNVTITVTRTGGSLGGPVSVDYATADGTATAAGDYNSTSGTLTFNPGETTKSFSVPITNDTTHEGAEQFTIALSNPVGGAALGATATSIVAIADDDAAPVDPGTTSGSGTGSGTGTGTNTNTNTNTSTNNDSGTLQSTPGNPNPDGSQTAAADKRAPKVTLVAKRTQKALKAKLLALTAKCDENCKFTIVAKIGKGRKTITLGKAKGSVARGKKAAVKVKLSKKSLAKLVQAMRHGKVKVTFSVVAKDAAGNAGKATRAVTARS